VPLEPTTKAATLLALSLSLLGDDWVMLHSTEVASTVAQAGVAPITLTHAVDPVSLARLLVVDAWDDDSFPAIYKALSSLAYMPPRSSDDAPATTVSIAPDSDHIAQMLDTLYVTLLKDVLAKRLVVDLAAIAEPLEAQAQAREAVVAKVKALLLPTYNTHGIPMPPTLAPPPLSGFALEPVADPVLHLSSLTAPPSECDAELKRALLRTSEDVKRARKKRKMDEVAARERVAASNCEMLVRPLLALPSAQPVVLAKASVVLSGTPGTISITPAALVFEPWRFSAGPPRVEWRLKTELLGLEHRAGVAGLVETCALRCVLPPNPPTEFTLLPGTDQGRALQAVVDVLVHL